MSKKLSIIVPVYNMACLLYTSVLRATKNITNVPVCHREREEGNSGYTLKKLLGLWFNGFTAFSVKPLRIATSFGVGFAGLGFLYGIYTIIKRLVNPNVPCLLYTSRCV